MRIVYFVNQYPKVSHSFIRREIRAVERQGIAVDRIAIRGWDAVLADSEDQAERTRTRYVLQHGVLPLIAASLLVFLASPLRFSRAFRLALRIWRASGRALFYHLAYLCEASWILRWLRGSEVAHMHAHFSDNSTEVLVLVNALGGPGYSFTAHGGHEFEGAPMNSLPVKLRHATFAVAISSHGRAQLYRSSDVRDWPKVNRVHCGLERGFYDVPVMRQSARRLVCVGRLCPEKGQLLLVQAIGRLVAEGTEVELVLAGDGDLREEIESEVARLRVSNHVHITGWVSETRVREEILAARALVLPSFVEGLPVVLMEAMALRRPVLSTYVGGIPELVIPGEHGWLFPAGDLDALTEAIRLSLSCSPETLNTMGDAACARVLSRHSADVTGEKMAALFRAQAAP